MSRRPELRTTLLTLDEGFRFHGPDSRVAVTVTTDLPAPVITHQRNRSALGDRAVLHFAATGPVEVPDPTEQGWVDHLGRPVTGWSYDLAVTVTAPDRPAVQWVGTISPTSQNATVTLAHGATPGGAATANGAVTVTETNPGEYTIGA